MKVTRAAVLKGAILALLAPYVAYTLFGVGRPQLSTLFNEGFHCGLILIGASLAWARAIRVRQDRAAWGFIAAGITSYAVGELVYYAFLAQLKSPPYPSIADAFWLAFYPASYVGLALLLRRRIREFQSSLWLDGVIASLAAAAVGATIVFGIVKADTSGSAAAVATNLAYPLADIVLVSIVAAAYALGGRRPGRAWLCLGAGLCMFAIGDSGWLIQATEGTYYPGEALDLLWPVGALLMGAAAWTPARHDDIQLTGMRRIVLPVACCLVAIAIGIYDHFHHISVVASFATTALLVAITVRFAMSFSENLRMLAGSKQDASTDALTGLGNRRQLAQDLSDRLAEASSEEPLVLAIFDLNGFKGYNDTFGHPAGDALLSRLARRLEAASAERGGAYRLGGDEFCVLLTTSRETPEKVVETAVAALAESGEGFRVTASHGLASLPNEASTYSDAMRLADRRMYAQKHAGRQSSSGRSSDVLLHALSERSPDLADHGAAVAETATRVARWVGLSDGEVDEIRLAAELHDIGKIGVPEEILQKRGRLTKAEHAFIEHHSLIGERILLADPGLTRVAKLVRSSHERWDGEGYPDELAGDEIPLGSRIIAICDSFDAMISVRPYRSQMTRRLAVAELNQEAGSQFDPVLVDAFVETMADRTADAGLMATSAA